MRPGHVVKIPPGVLVQMPSERPRALGLFGSKSPAFTLLRAEGFRFRVQGSEIRVEGLRSPEVFNSFCSPSNCRRPGFQNPNSYHTPNRKRLTSNRQDLPPVVPKFLQNRSMLEYQTSQSIRCLGSCRASAPGFLILRIP